MQKQILLIVLISLAVFQVHSSDKLSQEYKDYQVKHGKSYS